MGASSEAPEIADSYETLISSWIYIARLEKDEEYSDDGKLIVTEDDIETVLTVLNNSRLKSPVNQVSFNVDVKH